MEKTDCQALSASFGCVRTQLAPVMELTGNATGSKTCGWGEKAISFYVFFFFQRKTILAKKRHKKFARGSLLLFLFFLLRVEAELANLGRDFFGLGGRKAS
jgi:hypothetical protein